MFRQNAVGDVASALASGLKIDPAEALSCFRRVNYERELFACIPCRRLAPHDLFGVSATRFIGVRIVPRLRARRELAR